MDEFERAVYDAVEKAKDGAKDVNGGDVDTFVSCEVKFNHKFGIEMKNRDGELGPVSVDLDTGDLRVDVAETGGQGYKTKVKFYRLFERALNESGIGTGFDIGITSY